MKIEHRMRYYMEQVALPSALYADGSQFLKSFLLDEERAMRIYYKKAEEANPTYTCPYKASDFSVYCRKYIGNFPSFLIVKIEMPKPEYALLSRSVYLCLADYGSKALYLTSELGADQQYYLCGIDEHSSRLNFGSAPSDENEEFDHVSEIFKKMGLNKDYSDMVNIEDLLRKGRENI